VNPLPLISLMTLICTGFLYRVCLKGRVIRVVPR
jgi:hypothetical protein